MKTITRIIAGLTISLLGITDPVSALPNFSASLNGSGTTRVAPRSPGLAPEPQPTLPSIVYKTTNSIRIEWQDRFSGETGNIVERRKPGGLWVFVEELGPVYGVRSYQDSGLPHATPYCYRIQVHGYFGRKFSPERCTSTNRMRSDGVPVVDDPLGLVGELKTMSDGQKLIYIDNKAAIDLTPYPNLVVPEGVTLASGREKLNKGALLFTRNREGAMLKIKAKNVRITGLRIQGPELGIGDDKFYGIYIDLRNMERPFDSSNKIEIDHNEIYGWSGAAIMVQDSDEVVIDNLVLGTVGEVLKYGVINGANADAVHVHDNFIHHNQHKNGAGYGVVLDSGAYALIERNVFDYNRHAIAGDGKIGTGYKAYANLILKNGGVHCVEYIGCGHTHQFDMHGRADCGIVGIFTDTYFNCGLAGEYMDIRRNTFQYTAGESFKLRGTPERFDTPGIEAGAYVVSNVFAHLCVLPDLHCPSAALSQTQSGLHERDNLSGIETSDELGEGDFDGDGVADMFQPTGATWWYSSGGQTEWRYLNTSDFRLSDLFLGDFDGDGKTDVLRRSGNDWLVSCGGTGPWIKADRLACRQLGPGTFFAPIGISQK